MPGSRVPAAKSTAQEWVALRVRSVADGLLVRGDGVPLGVVRVDPAAMALLSKRERGVRVAGLREALLGIDGVYQIISVQRSVDLDAYLASLEGVVREAAGAAQRGLAREYLAYTRGVVSGGEAREQRHYVLLGPTPDQRRAWKQPEARKAAADLAAALERAGLVARQASAAELVDLLATYLQPGRRADEPVTEPAGITVWGGVGA